MCMVFSVSKPSHTFPHLVHMAFEKQVLPTSDWYMRHLGLEGVSANTSHSNHENPSPKSLKGSSEYV